MIIKLLNTYSYENFCNLPFAISLSETWLNEFSEENFPIGSYHPIVSNIRKDNSSRGGVALYVREELDFEKRPEFSKFIPCIFESIFVTLKDYNVTLGAIYRTPSSDPQ